ncbi:NYN domain-containing protein [Reinekea blandensis]|uniref:NYN domain-containing protein n=1 Tax=Reinekea blandensis MED297 TaxID=314283 RepID=A4B8V2_9GAMM|nr:NYN domain-containing protein [Reinekea blandensis]EAR11053.1 hypothetical protein MED297_19237 [Reinekea sp. MED297] [Reinekea blandensis MED297]
MTAVAILVDVQNVYYTTRHAFRRNFDYNRFWAQVSEQGTIVLANAYAVDRGDEKQKQFQNILRAIGFNVKLKPFIQRADGSAKGDWDVGITIDALDAAQLADTVVLVTGDGDFTILVDKLRNDLDRRVEVYGVPSLTAKSLMDAADAFIPIDDSLLLPG